MRCANALARGYFQVDLSIVWNTLYNDLPPLRQQIEAAFKGMNRQSGGERSQGQGSGDDLAL